MPVRHAQVEWKGTFKEGSGVARLGSGQAEVTYRAATRFEEEPGSNPEELLAGALAACFSMALAARLTRNETPPNVIATSSTATIVRVEGEWTITGFTLTVKGDVPGLSPADFEAHARAAKEGCPVSRALKAVPIELTVEG
jgi:osmotically inducible protein OsmC